MKTQTEQIDMMAELFIDKLQEKVWEYWIPPLSADKYLIKVQGTQSLEEKKDVLQKLVLCYRSETMSNKGYYTEDIRNKFVRTFLSLTSMPLIKENIAEFLLREGGYCEKVRDYESGAVFYAASAGLSVEDPFIRYFSLNNLGFCLNFIRKFDEAEKVLRQAIAFDPGKYNSWKNLGVSLEWQGQYEEAAESFLKAYNLSKGEPRAHLHLKRLLDRHPTLKKLPCFS